MNNDIHMLSTAFVYSEIRIMYIHVHISTMPFWNRKRQLVVLVFIVSSAERSVAGKRNGKDRA